MTQLKRQLKLHGPASSTIVPASTLPATRPIAVKNAHDVREGKSCNHDEELRLELALPTEVQAEPTDSLSVTESSDSKEPTENHVAPIVEVHEELPRKAPEDMVSNEASPHAENNIDNRPDLNSDSDTKIKKVVVLDNEKELELFLIIENEEREKIILQLNEKIEKERKSVERLQELLAETTLYFLYFLTLIL